jgi:hypothetical protein
VYYLRLFPGYCIFPSHNLHTFVNTVRSSSWLHLEASKRSVTDRDTKAVFWFLYFTGQISGYLCCDFQDFTQCRSDYEAWQTLSTYINVTANHSFAGMYLRMLVFLFWRSKLLYNSSNNLGDILK